MKKILMLIVVSLLTFQVYGIGSVTGKITHIRVDGTGRVMIFFDKPIAGTPPGCVHNAYKSALGVDANTNGGIKHI